MSFVFGSNSASTGYNLTRSLRFRASATAYLNRTPAVAGSRTTWTWSGWVKRGALPSGTTSTLFNAVIDSNNRSRLYFESDNTLNFLDVIAGSVTSRRTSSAVYRDPSAWYHIVCTYDTTNATASNRIRLYVNGTQLTAFSSSTDPSLNYASGLVNSTNAHEIGRLLTEYFDGYLTEVNFIDGQALTPSSFGSTNALTGVWQPAAYTGSYGTNGFELNFTDNSALTTSSNVGLGKDFSGNANYWVTNNISITAGVTYDSMTDVPTLTSATASNFCVMNPISIPSNRTSYGSITNANLTVNASSGVAGYWALGTMGVSSGKIYFEVTATTVSALAYIGLNGIFDSADSQTNTKMYISDGNKYINGTGSAYGATYTSGDVIGVAVDFTGGTITFYKNNVSQGAITTTFTTVYSCGVTSNSGTVFNCNFGQRPFTYTAPTGFVALNTYNLPTSTIVKGNTVMDATLWAGNSSTQSIVNAAAFKTDFVWIKNRTGANSHALFDSVRGATKRLYSDSTLDEQTEATTLTAFNSNGFSVSTSGAVNASANNYVGWQWQAGQGSTSSNTNGTITSTVSVNASAGFSVVTYTGTGANATVGHGLGVAPSMVIARNRPSSADSWCIYHVGLTSAAYFIKLQTTDAQASGASVWNSTAPTSSVFSVGSSTGSNGSTNAMVAYCWTPIAGFSAFGSYTGNGSTDGTFVYTGFRPKFIMIKRSDTAGNSWRIWDTARAPYNAGLPALYPNQSDAEDSITDVYDLVSNGFKLRTSAAGTNASSSTYIYMAFAESPFRNSLAR